MQSSRWVCEQPCPCCWNTFDTGGVCPDCGTAWKETQCLLCCVFSPHADWYHEFVPNIAETEVETRLLQKLADPAQHESARRHMVSLYQRTGRIEEAVALVETAMQNAQTPDECAEWLWARGCLAEDARNFRKAALFYQIGIKLHPQSSRNRYWLLNNLGFSLNQLGRHEAAEKVCRQAIHENPGFSNAWKNLGLSLKGQERFHEAAWQFLAAIRVQPYDERNRVELQRLLDEHPEMFMADPTLKRKIEELALF